MNEVIKQHVLAYSAKKGYGTTDKDLFEIIRECGKEVYSEVKGSHRWYDKEFKVVDLDGMLIGYDDFHTTGDSNWHDLGLEHDINSIVEVEKRTKTVDFYTAK
jgi:hypothetical protein